MLLFMCGEMIDLAHHFLKSLFETLDYFYSAAISLKELMFKNATSWFIAPTYDEFSYFSLPYVFFTRTHVIIHSLACIV